MLFNLFRLHDKDETIRKTKGKQKKAVAETNDETSMNTTLEININNY